MPFHHRRHQCLAQCVGGKEPERRGRALDGEVDELGRDRQQQRSADHDGVKDVQGQRGLGQTQHAIAHIVRCSAAPSHEAAPRGDGGEPSHDEEERHDLAGPRHGREPRLAAQWRLGRAYRDEIAVGVEADPDHHEVDCDDEQHAEYACEVEGEVTLREVDRRRTRVDRLRRLRRRGLLRRGRVAHLISRLRGCPRKPEACRSPRRCRTSRACRGGAP